jgi:hypothetical protein
MVSPSIASNAGCVCSISRWAQGIQKDPARGFELVCQGSSVQPVLPTAQWCRVWAKADQAKRHNSPVASNSASKSAPRRQHSPWCPHLNGFKAPAASNYPPDPRIPSYQQHCSTAHALVRPPTLRVATGTTIVATTLQEQSCHSYTLKTKCSHQHIPG